MNSVKTFSIVLNSLSDTLSIAGTLGRKLKGGEVIELIGDLGSGKTVFVRGLAKGIGSKDQVQSPSFTISRIYKGRSGLQLHHFDFHRLEEPGIIKRELAEILNERKHSVVIEWSDVVRDILPKQRLRIKIETTGEQPRQFRFEARDDKHRALLKDLK